MLYYFVKLKDRLNMHLHRAGKRRPLTKGSTCTLAVLGSILYSVRCSCSCWLIFRRLLTVWGNPQKLVSAWLSCWSSWPLLFSFFTGLTRNSMTVVNREATSALANASASARSFARSPFLLGSLTGFHLSRLTPIASNEILYKTF